MKSRPRRALARLHRQVGRFFTFQNMVDVAGSAPKAIDGIWPVCDQATVGHEQGVNSRRFISGIRIPPALASAVGQPAAERPASPWGRPQLF